MSWQPEIDASRRREAMGHGMGGASKIGHRREGGIQAACKAGLAEAPDREARPVEILGRPSEIRSPFRIAETFGVEEIVDPRYTRGLSCDFATLAAPTRKSGPASRGHRP